ncbi:MAG: rhodanese-like domain-containing protein [Anaerolineales bacterium]
MLLILAGLAWVLLNTSATPVSTPTPASVDQVQRVSPEDAKKAFDAGKAVFVDVRDSISYHNSHIPGALLVPINELTGQLKELNPSSWIITYCT